MDIINVADVGGVEFPAGRRTRVLVGPDAPLEAERFVMGHVTIFPGGSVPIHSHEQEEVYFIIEGEGSIEWLKFDPEMNMLQFRIISEMSRLPILKYERAMMLRGYARLNVGDSRSLV